MILLCSMLFSMAVPAFAANRSIEKSPNCSIPQGDTKEPFANRYDFVTVKGEEHVLFIETKDEHELTREQATKISVNSAITVAGKIFAVAWPATTATKMAVNIVSYSRGVGMGAEIIYYARSDVRYRIDSLTGDRVAISTTYILGYRLYKADGTLHNTFEYSTHK